MEDATNSTNENTYGLMTAHEAWEQATAQRANTDTVERILGHYRGAIHQESLNGKFSVPLVHIEQFEGVVTRHDLVEVERVLVSLNYTVAESGISWRKDENDDDSTFHARASAGKVLRKPKQ